MKPWLAVRTLTPLMPKSFPYLPLFLLSFCAPLSAAKDPGVVTSSTTLPLETTERPTRDTKNNKGPTTPDRVLPGEPTRHKNYFIPLVEIPIFQLALNGADRLIYGNEEYGSNFHTGWEHVRRGPWTVDRDAFVVNQIGHPYQGSVYYGLARSSGLNFWESLLYANGGSFLWETFGETTDPSINDQVASGMAGSILGEPLYRLYNLVLERGGENPSRWRKIGAALISPPTALNRLIFGDRYSPILPTRGPATFTRLEAGAGWNTRVDGDNNTGRIGEHFANLNFSTDYGLPGKPGYRYQRPFDYFHLEGSVQRDGRKNYENLMTRGLLFGQTYESGNAYRGIWGLYGSFDYISPEIFRFSTTAASLGTTAQWWLRPKIALQGTGMLGMGYGSAGTITPQGSEQDYHYGASPQGLLALRMIFGKRFIVETTGRQYFITPIGASKAPGSEHITRLTSSVLFRIYKGHALGVNYALATRSAKYTVQGIANQRQTIETVGLSYNFIWDHNLGAVSWNDSGGSD